MPSESKWLDRSLNPGWQDDKMPIVNVHWGEARNFCEWIEGRLPTEKEWEYAARAGLEGARYGELDSIAWYADNSGRDRIDGAKAMKADPKKFGDSMFKNRNAPHQVGQKAANPWGLYDILGNLWEWTSDAYDSESRVLRGGAWSGVPSLVRFSARARSPESHRSNSIGLRCVWMGK